MSRFNQAGSSDGPLSLAMTGWRSAGVLTAIDPGESVHAVASPLAVGEHRRLLFCCFSFLHVSPTVSASRKPISNQSTQTTTFTKAPLGSSRCTQAQKHAETLTKPGRDHLLKHSLNSVPPYPKVSVIDLWQQRL